MQFLGMVYNYECTHTNCFPFLPSVFTQTSELHPFTPGSEVSRALTRVTSYVSLPMKIRPLYGIPNLCLELGPWTQAAYHSINEEPVLLLEYPKVCAKFAVCDDCKTTLYLFRICDY